MKTGKKILCLFLVVMMLLGSAPLSGLTGIELPWASTKAQAAGVAGYNAIAAAQWAKDHVNDVWSCLYGQGYWYDGGDCANFVSQCIYMGGVDQSAGWNHSGYKAHYSNSSDGSWIRATQLHNYVVSIGGQEIQNPSASQLEVGDLMFYKKNPGTNNRWTHCAIVVDVDGGTVSVAAHSVDEVRYIKTDWHLGFSNEGTYVVKMHGATCTDQVIRDFDVYTATSNTVMYSSTSTSSTRYFGWYSGEYVHVYDKKTVNGVEWGYTCGYGSNSGFRYGWVKMSTLKYKCHVSTGPVDHIMGEWYVKVQPTCSTVGIEKRVCSRCGYTEQRNMSIGGAHKNVVAATCLNPSYCTACGATISSALGHDWGEWEYTVAPTCLKGGHEKRICQRCNLVEERDCNALGHNYQPTVTIPGCVTNGTSTYTCTRCGDSYVDKSEWSAWTADYNEQYFKNNLIPSTMYESRLEYRFRDKQYKNVSGSTSSSAPSYSGWNWQGTAVDGYTSWGSTQTAYSQPSTSDLLQVTGTGSYVSGTEPTYTTYYVYYRYYVPSNTYYGNSSESSRFSAYEEYLTTYKLTISSTTQSTDGKVNGYKAYYKNDNMNTVSGNYKTLWYGGTRDVQTGTKDVYSTCWYYQTRAYTYNHSYWQWGNWSSWGTTAYSSSGTRDVETRTTYRVKQAALGHAWDSGVTVAATCHEEGCTLYTCKRCGATMKQNVTPALGDLWGEKYLVSDENGVKVYRQDCVRFPGADGVCQCGCYKTFIDSCVYEVSNVVAPTCTEQGYTTYTCTLHGETYNSDYVDPLGHEADGQWSVTKAPTCTEDGEEMCKCVRHDDGKTCDKTFTRPVSAVGHDLVKTEAVKATCEKDGNSEYYQCKNCNKYYSDAKAEAEIEENSWIIEATGHNGLDESGNEVWVKESEAGCGETGRECVYCLNEWCDYDVECDNDTHEGHHYLIKEREIEEIPAEYAIVEHKDPTCIDLGYDVWQCVNCYGTDHEHGWTDILTLTEHDWGEPTTTYATCTTGGIETVVCNYCGLVDSYGTSDATGHALSPLDDGYAESDDKMELISSVKNGCGTGSVDTYQCTHIDKNTNERCTYKVVIGEANDHNLGDDIITQEPTCTEDGYKHKECQNEGCEYRTADEIIPATGHDWELKNTVAPTCETSGYDHYVCKNDSRHEYDDKNVSSLGHEADGKWVVTKEPTCAEKGEKQCKCVRYDDGVTCEKIFSRELEIVEDAHDWGEWIITKEPTYDDTGMKKQICQNDSSHVNWEILPVITKDSEKNENVETDKTVDYDALTGEAVIRLTASSNGEKIVTKSRTPLDIVLVLDQSGSMEGELKKNLMDAATAFTQSIYNDAVDNNLDHRIAMVGFAMQNQGNYSSEYYQYLNTEVLTTGSKPIGYGDATNATYKNALVSVNKDNKLNPVLTTAIGNIEAKGATATDLGLDMACKIFSQNENDGTRKRIVVLMSDGVPTYSNSSSSEDVESAAYHAKLKADLLKNTYHADIYSVGLLSALNDRETYGKTYGRNFLKSVASTDTNGNPLYYDCNNASALVENFSKIAEESTIIRSDFDDVTLIDTVSKAFTLTSKQENQLRVDAIEKLGVTNDDITITRFNDGTTQVTIKHITPKKVENGDDIRFVIDFSFSVTANENALVAGSYVTNTDNAGVIVGVKDVYENNFAVPSDNVEEAEGVIYFNINGITYHVLRVHAGDKIEQPEIDLEGKYTFSGWDLPDEITFDGGKYTVDATLTQTAYTVTWVMGDETVTDTYNCGDVIAVPSVKNNSNGDEFASWDKEIPTTMPAKDLTFTASYTKHVHEWVTSTTTSEMDQTAYANVYCKKCGASPEQSLSYTIISESGRMQQSQELNLVDANDIKINVDGSITISLPVPNSMRYARTIKVYRTEADGSKTDLKATRSGSYVTFTTDHFSEYTLFAVYECDETGKHIDEDCDKFCDICGKTFSFLDHNYVAVFVKNATCTEDGYTTYECSKCGDTYQGDKVKAFGHADADGDGHCDACGTDVEGASSSCTHLCHNTNAFIRFIWKIVRFFCKLFKIKQYCSCGVKHW